MNSLEQSVNSVVKFVGDSQTTAATGDILGPLLLLLIIISTIGIFYFCKKYKSVISVLSIVLTYTLTGAFLYNTNVAEAESVNALNMQSTIEATVNEDGSFTIPNFPIKNTDIQKNITLENIKLTSKSIPSVTGSKWTFTTTYEGTTHKTEIVADGQEHPFDKFIFKPNEEYIFSLTASGIEAKPLIGQDVLDITITYRLQENIQSSVKCKCQAKNGQFLKRFSLKNGQL